MKRDILSMDPETLTREILAIGLPRFRAGQVFRWLHRSGVRSFDEMTDLPKQLRETLSERYEIYACEI